jgi:hypothetical protein
VNAVTKDGLDPMINTCDLQGADGKMARAFYIHGIPSYYLIEETGKILSKGTLIEIGAALK